MIGLGNRSEGQHGGRRERSRLRVRLGAGLTTVSSTNRVVLHDLSLTGARVSAPPAIRVGQECILTWAGHEAFGAVVWVRGGLCGLVFEQYISPSLLIRTRDIQDLEPLPDDYEISRDAARSWASGNAKL